MLQRMLTIMDKWCKNSLWFCLLSVKQSEIKVSNVLYHTGRFSCHKHDCDSFKQSVRRLNILFTQPAYTHSYVKILKWLRSLWHYIVCKKCFLLFAHASLNFLSKKNVPSAIAQRKGLKLFNANIVLVSDFWINTIAATYCYFESIRF